MGKKRRASPIEPYLTGNGGSRAGGHPGEKDSLSSVEARPQCTYRCVVLPDCMAGIGGYVVGRSQCTYRCVVLPD